MSNSRGPTPPLSRSQSNSFLPTHVQQQQQLQAETTQLLRPLAIVQQQQQVKAARSWPALLQQLASRKAAAVFYGLLALALVWYVAAGRHKAAAGEVIQPQPTIVAGSSSSNTTTVTAEQLAKQAAASRSQDNSSKSSDTKAADTGTRGQQSTASSSSSSSELSVRCPYGALPGTWVSSAPTGSKWQLLDPNCQLKNWLAVYAAAAAAAADSNSGPAAAAAAAEDGDSDDSGAEVLPMVNMLLLSDSVDRYIVQHVCDYLQGVKHTIRARQQHMNPVVPEPPAAAAAAAADAGGAVQGTAQAVPNSSSSSSSGASGPSNLNATAYAFHTCQLSEGVPLKLASSYFPGVHPTGPFHRGLTQNYAARIDAAAAMWEEYAGAGQPPHVVSVASALWDVARLWLHERQQLQGPELSRPLLDSWVTNFSAVVQCSKQQLPQTQLWLTHTTMLPAHDVTTGAMTKPYLGRRYFIEQLNAAAAAAARQLNIQLVDYAAVSSRFREGQQHLADLIHPNAEVALEVFNVLLNLALELRGL